MIPKISTVLTTAVFVVAVLGSSPVSAEDSAARAAGDGEAHCLPTFTACSGAIAVTFSACAEGDVFAGIIGFEVCINTGGAAAATNILSTGLQLGNQAGYAIETASVSASTDSGSSFKGHRDCTAFGFKACSVQEFGTSPSASAQACHVRGPFASMVACAKASAAVPNPFDLLSFNAATEERSCNPADFSALSVEQQEAIEDWFRPKFEQAVWGTNIVTTAIEPEFEALWSVALSELAAMPLPESDVFFC